MMDKKSVFITRHIPEEGLVLLRDRGIDVHMPRTDRPLSRRILVHGLQSRDGVICTLADRIDKDVIGRAKNLRVISNFAAGYDNVDLAAATERGIVVTNTPNVLTEATADLTFALILAIARRVPEGDRLTRRGDFKGWGPLFMLGHDVWGKTLGIVGAGRIGQAVGMRAKGFGMKILYNARNRKQDFEQATGAQPADLETLLGQSDFVSLHCPLTAETRHMIGTPQLRLMKRTAYLINVARGPVVDEKALVKALEEELLAGAGLDVYEKEPKVDPGLVKCKRVVLLPHVGSATVETRARMSRMAAENLIEALEGRTPRYVVNTDVLKAVP